MPHLFMDVESYSTCDLTKTGAERYARDQSTGVFCVCYAVDDGPIETWIPGDPVPEVVIQAATADGWILVAHNIGFEDAIWEHILTPRYGWPAAGRWSCTMARARALAFPGSLEKVAGVLELDVVKDVEGAKLMKKLCKGDVTPTPEQLTRLVDYCKQDVAVLRQVHNCLPPLSDAEQAVWALDQVINRRGFHVDRALAEAINALAPIEKAEINDRLAEITDGAVTSGSQVDRILEFVRGRGCQMQALGKRNVAAVLARTTDEVVRKVLELRKRASKSGGISKAAAVLRMIGDDDRIRGCFSYHNASTGRWSGKQFQPQNLPKPRLGIDLDVACQALLSGDLERVRALGDPLAVASDVTRCLVNAALDHVLIGADYSSIEARVIAWLSDETWKLEAFRRFDAGQGGDVYCVTASKILGRHVTKEDKAARQVGKIAELAGGFGGWVGAWRRFAEDDPRTDDEIAAAMGAWRDAHPNIVCFWYELERALVAAVRAPGKEFKCGRLVAEASPDGGMLWLRLPSGRRLAFPEPGLIPGKKKGSVTVEFKDNSFGKWVDERGWHGKFIENAVSGIARDLQADALLRLEAAGYHIVTHCHDDIASEVPEGFGSVQDFVFTMTQLPDWAKGLPVAAEGWSRTRYAEPVEAAAVAPVTPEPVTELPDKPDDINIDVNIEDDDCPFELGFDVEEKRTAELEAQGGPGAGGTANNIVQFPPKLKANGFAAGAYTLGDQEEPRGSAQLDRQHLYVDAAGLPHTRHDIYRAADGKKFGPIYHRNGAGWVKGRPQELIPYRLPWLLAASPADVVCITEGEKDADTLASLGFVATTQPLGAGKWEPGLNVHFAGKNVVVFEDNDDAGRQNTAVVRRALAGVVSKIAGPVAFPELPAHGDVSDWVTRMQAAGIAADAVRTLLRERIEDGFRRAAEAAKAPSEPWLWHGTPDPRPRQKWRIKHLMPVVGTGLLSGQWGTYKTFAAINLATTIMAAGQTFCGREVIEPCGVAIFATEGAFDLRDRVDAAVRDRWPEMTAAPITWREACPILLADGADAQLNALIAEASQACEQQFGMSIGLVIIDVLTDAAGYSKAGDENDPSIAARIMGTLRRVAESNGCFVLAVDHFGKSIEAGTRGSSAKEGAADVVIACLGEREVSGSVANTRLALRKVRGGIQGEEFPYRPRVVALARDADAPADDSLSDSTLVIDWESAGTPKKPKFDDPWKELIHHSRQVNTKLSLKVFRRALTKALQAHGADQMSKDDGVVHRMVDAERVREQFFDLAASDGATERQKQDAKRKAYERTLGRVIEHELVGRQDAGGVTYLWVIQS